MRLLALSHWMRRVFFSTGLSVAFRRLHGAADASLELCIFVALAGQGQAKLVSEREALFQASGPEGPAASKFLERLKIWPRY